MNENREEIHNFCRNRGIYKFLGNRGEYTICIINLGNGHPWLAGNFEIGNELGRGRVRLPQEDQVE